MNITTHVRPDTEDAIGEAMRRLAAQEGHQGNIPYSGGKAALTGVQRSVLALLDRPRTAREIADAMGIGTHQAHNNIRALRDKCLVRRVGSDGQVAIYERIPSERRAEG